MTIYFYIIGMITNRRGSLGQVKLMNLVRIYRVYNTMEAIVAHN